MGNKKNNISAHILNIFFTEIAEYFKCSGEGVNKACKRLGITHKKKDKLHEEKQQESNSDSSSSLMLYFFGISPLVS